MHSYAALPAMEVLTSFYVKIPKSHEERLKIAWRMSSIDDIVSDIPFGSIYIYGMMLFKFITTFFLANTLSGICSDIHSGIFYDNLSGILSGIYFDILSGIFWGIRSGICSEFLSDILSGILTCIWRIFWHSFWQSMYAYLRRFFLVEVWRGPLRSIFCS